MVLEVLCLKVGGFTGAAGERTAGSRSREGQMVQLFDEAERRGKPQENSKGVLHAILSLEDQVIVRLGRDLRDLVSQSSMRRTHLPGGEKGLLWSHCWLLQSLGTGSSRASSDSSFSNGEQ